MTTSYELSLRLKELGAAQGERHDGKNFFYWVKIGRSKTPQCIHACQFYDESFSRAVILCRAFTLGELVRLVGDEIILHKLQEAWRDVYIASYDFNTHYFEIHNTTPEEAAAELYCEILKQKA